jgi:hypothetical protein
MVYGKIPMRHFRRIAERRMPETISVIKQGTTYDPYGGQVLGDPYVAHTTKGNFRSASATEVANYQRMDERVEAVIKLAVDAAPYVDNEDRLYRAEAGLTYEITGIKRDTPDYESFVEVMVREADPERSYNP